MQVATETTAFCAPPCPRSHLNACHAWPIEQDSSRRHRRVAARQHAVHCRRRRSRMLAHADDSEASRDLWNSKFFSSDIVWNEFEGIMEQFKTLTHMQPKWVDFDVVGKRLFLEQMQEFTERLGIFITRCRLSDDPAAKAMMNRVDVSYLHAGISMQAMHEGLLDKSKAMQTWVEAEEAIPSNDYVAQSAFKAELQQAFQVVPDLKAFFEEPELAACLSDPQALGAVTEVLKDPAAAAKYKGTQLEPLASKLASQVLLMRGQSGSQ